EPVDTTLNDASSNETFAPNQPNQATGLSLEETIQLALASNPDLASASAQIAAADAVLCKARAEFYPKLGITEQYGVTNNPVMSFMYQLNQTRLNFAQDFNDPQTVDNFHTQLRFQHSIYTGERRQHALHAAAAGSNAASLSLVALQNQMTYQVAEAYYRLLQARDLAKVRQQAVQQVQQHLDIVTTRFENDTAVKSDVLTVEVRLAEEQESLISARNQLELAWAVLENVVGAPLSGQELPEAIPTAPWSQQVEELEYALSVASGQRAEIGAMTSQQQAASEQVLMAQAGKRLGIDFVADYDVYTGDFQTGNDSFFAGVIFHLNLFDGGRTRIDMAQAAAKVTELRAQQRRLMLDIELDVRRSYLQLKDAEERLKVASQAIEQASESLREIEVRYRGQSANITQMVDAQVALSNARVRQATAQAEVEVARAALQRSSGRLTDLL
ncbi:MAG: TolC family protein, partial [Planctomycetales bacterium]|nr:TolC family protein [Planctomycetales bacterium]